MAATVGSVLIPIGIDLLKTEVIPWVIKLIDHVVGNKTPAKPDLGPAVKFPAAATIIQALDAALAAAGVSSPSTVATIEGAIQDVVNKLNLTGTLNGKDTVVTSAPGVGPVATPATNSAGAAVSGIDANRLLGSILGLVAAQLAPPKT